jgi:RNA polymerase sigma-70 factor (ECF subfamily)
MTTQYAAISETDNPLTDAVCAAQCGDRRAFGRLIENFERAVYATAFKRLGNHADAQELCQDVFLQAMRSITDRMAINRMTRRRACTWTGTDYIKSTSVENRTPLMVILDREKEDQVRRGLRRLCPMDRETLMAFYFDGRSIIEMSKKFGTPIGTIKRRLHVARKRLAKQLEALSPA